MFKVKSFEEVVKMTKEAIDITLAPIRARGAKGKAAVEVAKIEEKLVALELEINKLCTEKELDFDKITAKIDDYALNERRLNQIKQLVADLFPGSAE